MSAPILRIAVPSPLRRSFDYLAPPGCDPTALRLGVRVRVPFGRQHRVGVLVQVVAESPAERLKPAEALLDSEPLLTGELPALLGWACDYYHHPPGEVYLAALPVALRQGQVATARVRRVFRLSELGRAQDPAQLARAPRQAALLRRLAQAGAASAELLQEEAPGWQAPMKRLLEQGLVEMEEQSALPASTATPGPAPALNAAQQAAVAAVTAGLGGFQPFLLEGVTGSGKTEVYLGIIDAVLARGEQALVLVPEIGLTPQLVERFRSRFPVPVAVLHSGLADGERLAAWLAARDGSAPVVIGTRSALFTPLARPGVIIVDEEHDPSYKQQEGFRYSGRDGAVMRARLAGVPVLLGSATPSLESVHNAREGRYALLHLPERAGAAKPPRVRLLDLRGRQIHDGLSPELAAAVQSHLDRDGQVLLFLNRRGYAPVLLCHECGWVSNCRRCDARLTLYAGDKRLRCHHCGTEQPVPRQCPDCGSPDLRPLGQGTERIEEGLARRFGAGVVRIDRDSTRRKGALEGLLEQVHGGEARLLIGTQMLAKGHHFPNVTLVGILDADQGLFSVDFRAAERMAQLIVQVAGRAGRAERPGEVLIQTHHPDHPLLQRLVAHDYRGFADTALAERRATRLPPFGYLALLRAEAVQPQVAMDFLTVARDQARELGAEGVELLGPVPAPMERRAGRFRAQLLLVAERRADLHRLLARFAPALEGLKEGRKARWSLDVDPAEMY